MADNIAHAKMLFYPLYYVIRNKPNKSKNHTGIGFAENRIVSWDFKVRISIRITKDSDNGDSDNQGSIVSQRQKSGWSYKILRNVC